MASIGDRLQSARTRLFVGRDPELQQFRSALTAEPPPFNVLHVFGPGGVGKTELLQAFARCCDDTNVPCVQLDTRDVDPTPDAFRTALRNALGLDPDRAVLPALGTEDDRVVLLLDTVETIEALDDWLRTHFLPDLPEHVVVVMAGRNEPAAAWRTDPGWRALVHTMPLRNLDAEAGARLLRRRNVPPDQHDAILRFTHGHPLATALVADLMDQRGTDTFEPTDAPNVLSTLLERFVQKVPGPAHRAALETAALVRSTTEPVLRAALDVSDAHELFEWLRSLSFVRPGERGLVLHTLVRNALAADLRWRNPERHDTLHERARQFYTDRLKDAPTRALPDLLSDLTVLLRDHPFIRPFFDRLRSQWDEAEGLIEDGLRDNDRPVLREMAAAQEGAAAADLAQHWMDRQPEGVHVYRDGTGTPVGFLLTVALDAAAPEARAADPVAQHVWTHLEAHAPLRPGERASLFRFWMARDTGQAPSPVQSLIFIRQVRHYLQTPALAYSALACRPSDTWDALFRYADMDALSDAPIEAGGRPYAVYGHDWRARPPAQWLDRLAERGFDTTPEDPPSAAEDRVIVLSRSDFDDALTDAFKNRHRPDQLGDNPLLYSRLVTDAVGRTADVPERIEALCTLLDDTAEQLAADPRDEKYYRAVHRTYLKPAPTQEQAAEQLGVPFSTFRRHLSRGLDRVADILWEQEVGTAAP